MARPDENGGPKAPGDRTSASSRTGEEGLRPSGIDLIGGMSWGTHFCQFYETQQDLLEILVPYFREGLLGNEFCMWVTSPPLGVDDARNALRAEVPELDERIRAGQIEILDYTQWYKVDGRFEQGRVFDGWIRKLDDARARGFEGLRLTGNTFWLEPNDWKDFTQYEEMVNNAIGRFRMLAICTYPIEKCGAPEIIDVIANHQFAMVKRRGRWELVESSERKKAEEALRQSETRYRTMFEASVNQLVLMRAVRDEKGAIADWRYVDVNEHALEAMGLGRGQLVGRTLSQVIPDRAKEMGGRWSRVLASGRPVEYETDFGGRHFMVSVFRMDPETLVSSSIDITERKKAEAALRKALERNSQQEKLAAIGRLAGGVAHEIRNPLAAIKNAVYYLSMALENPDGPVIETLALLNREIARSEQIISSLLGLAHPGRAPRSNVDINQILRECLRQPRGTGVEVRLDPDGRLPAVRADPAQLAIAFGNIIRNAFESMTKGGCLRVSSRSEEGWVIVRFADTGHGISKENMGKIFEPLMTTKDGGTGLGLPVARTLVEGHGGTIEAESEPGQGSTFTVKLPTKPGKRAGE